MSLCFALICLQVSDSTLNIKNLKKKSLFFSSSSPSTSSSIVFLSELNVMVSGLEDSRRISSRHCKWHRHLFLAACLVAMLDWRLRGWYCRLDSLPSLVVNHGCKAVSALFHLSFTSFGRISQRIHNFPNWHYMHKCWQRSTHFTVQNKCYAREHFCYICDRGEKASSYQSRLQKKVKTSGNRKS